MNKRNKAEKLQIILYVFNFFFFIKSMYFLLCNFLGGMLDLVKLTKKTEKNKLEGTTMCSQGGALK